MKDGNSKPITYFRLWLTKREKCKMNRITNLYAKEGEKTLLILEHPNKQTNENFIYIEENDHPITFDLLENPTNYYLDDNNKIQIDEKYEFINLTKDYGIKYDNSLKVREISRLIRKELKPLIDLGFKFSVITKHSSKIWITIKEIPSDFTLKNPYYNQQKAWEFTAGKRNSHEPGQDPRQLLTAKGEILIKYIESLANQYQKHETIDYFDNIHQYVFYLGVDY